jgi:hypothetical protein
LGKGRCWEIRKKVFGRAVRLEASLKGLNLDSTEEEGETVVYFTGVLLYTVR